MKELPANLITEKNKVYGSDPWITMLEITLTDSTVIRLCNNNEDVVYDGNTYTSFPFIIDPIISDAEGVIPALSLKVSNVTRFLQPYLESLNGGLNSTVKLTIVNTGLLTEDYTELELTFTVMGCSSSSQWVEWKLGMANPYNRRFPLWRYLAEHCPWTFTEGVAVGVNVECSYIGAYTTCDHTLENCVLRENTANYGGYIGMMSGAVKLA